MNREQRYEAKALRVIDGDTFVAHLSLGFGVQIERKVRLRFINAPELRDYGVPNPAGEEARKFLQERLLGRTFEVVTHGKGEDKFGRIEGEVFVDSVSVNDEMVKKGLAVVYLCNAEQTLDTEKFV